MYTYHISFAINLPDKNVQFGDMTREQDIKLTIKCINDARHKVADAFNVYHGDVSITGIFRLDDNG